MAETNNKKPSFFARVGKWFREMKSELKKVVWPSRKQLINNTLIVLGAVLVVGIIVVLFDWVAGYAVRLLGEVI
ncbi:MAG: preprotein translocase subunit SecE [Oscillospiraceae bacterium]|nr:preprotein translocase subunit SecE [Oscillospiraceae bacterium]